MEAEAIRDPIPQFHLNVFRLPPENWKTRIIQLSYQSIKYLRIADTSSGWEREFECGDNGPVSTEWVLKFFSAFSMKFRLKRYILLQILRFFIATDSVACKSDFIRLIAQDLTTTFIQMNCETSFLIEKLVSKEAK